MFFDFEKFSGSLFVWTIAAVGDLSALHCLSRSDHPRIVRFTRTRIPVQYTALLSFVHTCPASYPPALLFRSCRQKMSVHTLNMF